MRPLELGLPLPTIGLPANEEVHSWEGISQTAIQAEQIGFDTVWIPDELVWRFVPDKPMGTWECVAIAAGVAAVTQDIKIGTWVLSALHRNPGLTVKAAETIDEISGGRFLFGFGSGHSGDQGEAFGYPPDFVVGRYEDALEIVVALLREGSVTYDGHYHSAFEQENTPRGPQLSEMPLILAGHGPRTIGLAVDHADVWSGYATTSSAPEAFMDLLTLVDRICGDKGRDPTTLERSVGVFLETTEGGLPDDAGLGVPLRGSPAEVAETVHEFAEMGVTMLEIVPSPSGPAAMEYFAELIGILDG